MVLTVERVVLGVEDEDANDEQHIELQQVQSVREERSEASTLQHHGVRANGPHTHRPVGSGDHHEH